MRKLMIAIYGLALLIGGSFMLMAGGQRLAAALLAQPAGVAKERIGDGATVPIAELDRAITALDQADGWHHHPRHQTDKALMELIRYEQHNLRGREAVGSLARARRELDLALKENPLDPYAWARLSYLYTLSPGPSFASSKALQRSYLTGPMDRNLTQTRIELALANWAVLDDATRQLMAHEAQLVWRGNLTRNYAYSAQRQQLIAAAVRFDQVGWLRNLVVATPKDGQHFDTMLRQERNRADLPIAIDAQERRR